jgi:hypothetical protein
LWEALLNLEVRRGNYDRLCELISKARQDGAELAEAACYEAIQAAEHEKTVFPDTLFGLATRPFDNLLAIWRVRHLLRLGEVAVAVKILDQALAGPHSADLWAYAATAWRMADDPRVQWLTEQPGLVQVIELETDLPRLDDLAEFLRNLHRRSGEYLDQSVRGGTQTDGPLFSRIAPIVRKVRSAVVAAVEAYVGNLPPIDPRHPLLSGRRDQPSGFPGAGLSG